MKSILILAVGSYLLICLLMWIGQRSILYFPPPRPQLALPAQSVSFQLKDISLQGWLVNPGKQKVILYYGGNAEAVENNIDFFTRVLPQFSVYLIPYRGYSGNPGQATEKLLYQDALAIFDQLQSQYSEVNLIGRSLGSGVATQVAAKREIARLALITPYDSISKVASEHYWYIPVELLIKDKYESGNRAGDIKAETLILAAAQDKVISNQRSEALALAFKPQQLTYVLLEGVGHNDIALHPRYRKELVRFFMAP